jgi:hypothetical protein
MIGTEVDHDSRCRTDRCDVTAARQKVTGGQAFLVGATRCSKKRSARVTSRRLTAGGKPSPAPVIHPSASEQNAAAKGQPSSTPKPVTAFTTILPSFVDPGLEAFLIEHKVEISAKPIMMKPEPAQVSASYRR